MNLKPLISDAQHLTRMGGRLVRKVGEGPELLCLFVTSRCDADCHHCFDHTRRGPEVEAQDFSLWELEQIARKMPRMYYLILTGGEPFTRADLDEVVLLFARHARPRIIAIPTNGGRTKTILAKVERILDELPQGVSLSVNVSLDDVGEAHDKIRRMAGLFERASETSRRLHALSKERDNLLVGNITVVSTHNQDHIHDVMEYVLDDLGSPSWAPFLVRGDPRDPESKNVDIEKYSAVAKSMEKRILSKEYAEASGYVGAALNSAKNVVRRELIEQTVREGRRVVPCTAGTHAAVVWADGRVATCEILDSTMGNLRKFDYDFGRLWKSKGADDARCHVRTEGCACTHENVLTTSVTFDWRQWPKLMRWTVAMLRVRRSELAEARLKPLPVPDTTSVEVSCFIPAFNEAEIICRTVRELDAVLCQVAQSHEIVVVDDGSGDGTTAAVEAMNHPRVRVVRFEQGPTFRGNLARSLLSGRGEILMFMDADLSAVPWQFAHILELLKGQSDVVVANRYLPDSHTVRSPLRHGLSRVYNRGLQVAFDSQIQDHQCGLKGFRRPVLAKILGDMTEEGSARRGWFWDAEVLIRAQRGDFQIDEVPTTWVRRGDSRAALWRQYRMVPWMIRLLGETRA